MMLPFLQQQQQQLQAAYCSILGHLQRQQVFIDINSRRSKYAECFSGQRALRMRRHCGCIFPGRSQAMPCLFLQAHRLMTQVPLTVSLN